MDKIIRGSDNQSENIRRSEDQIKYTPRHERLWVWQKAHQLRLIIHKICRTIPKDERFRLKDQIERSSNSVADNLAEGNSSYYYNEKTKHFYIARREAAETQNHIRNLEGKLYINVKESHTLIYAYEEVIRGINGLIRRVKQKQDISRSKGSPKL
ncbi:MAG: four helix bundle protein [Candidatus Saganbacteria bacterium]|nr:four helix bundle protein [Candidatus Saganbacteria bacterium]